jgi:hypothetical protein
MRPRRHCSSDLVGRVILSIACLFQPVLAGAAAEGSFHRVLQVPGVVNVDLTNGSGSVRVRRGGSNQVEVTGRIKVYGPNAAERLKQILANAPIQQVGMGIRIGYIDDSNLQRNVSINYDVIVPEEIQLRSETGSGNQSVYGIHGGVDLVSGSGNLRVFDTTGSIRAGTGHGRIDVQRIRGALKITTQSGPVTVQGDPTGAWTLHTGSGNVHLELPSNAAFDLDAHTSSGSIFVSQPVIVQIPFGPIGRKELRGKVHGGGMLVKVEAGRGNIDIR